jgi:photosystem II stability/assembly factor-like uncharacterized protein
MRWLAITALLVIAPTASAAGPWHQSGPPGFPVITAVATQGNSVYGLAESGDIWRSDAGAAWVKRSKRPKPGTDILTASPGSIYVSASDTAFLSRSTDGAKTFKRCRDDGLPVGKAYVVATVNQRVGVIRARRLALSSNGCRTWKRPPLKGNIRALARTGTTWLAIAERPRLPRASRFRLMASTDLGRTWTVRANRTALGIGSPARLTTTALVADRVTANRLWLIRAGKLARSDDGGRTWTEIATPGLRVTQVVPDATRANSVHVLALSPTRRPVVRTSSNAGASWADTGAPAAIGAVRVGTSVITSSNSRLAIAARGVWTYAF